MKHKLQWVGGILGGMILAGIVSIWIGHASKEDSEAIEQYGQILIDWKESKLVDHFPQPIPANAKNVKLSSFHGFLQGGGHVQLRMELSPKEVRKVYEEAAEVSKQHQDGGHKFTLVNERDDGLSSTNPHALDSEVYEFPEDYRIFILYAKPYKEGSDFDWNHGESKGLVVSLQRNEVIYYAESW